MTIPIETALLDLDPWTGRTIAEVATSTLADVDRACRAARDAQAVWADAPATDRAAVMRRAADVMERRREEIVDLLVRESGSTRIKASIEWAAVRDVMLEATTQAQTLGERSLAVAIPGKSSRVVRVPAGVVAVISPWNWPLQLSNRSVAPALAVGNAVVLKPSSETPITGGLLLASIFEDAGLPPGLLQVVIGAGEEIGIALVEHPIPCVVSFTGSTAVGREVARRAAGPEAPKRLELELGGSSPLVVLADADLELAVDAAVFGTFLHQGQICMIASRLIVDDAIHDAFVERYVERVRALPVGDPADPATVIGPIINRRQLDRLLGLIARARASCARELLGGAPSGLVLPPHVFDDVSNDHELAREEIFGPIAPIIRARGEEDALRLANDSPYGLSAAVFTRDVERGERFARGLRTGMAHVNDSPVNDLANSPFGGEKASGFGRFGGRWAVDAFTSERWITTQHTPRSYPF